MRILVLLLLLASWSPARGQPTTTCTCAAPTSTTASTTSTTLPGGSGTCGAPFVVPPSGGSFSGTTSGLSAQTGPCGSTSSSPEKVYQWTPSVSGTATADVCGPATTFDTVLYVRGGSCAGAPVACNDDACATSNTSTRGSRSTFPVTAGQPYFIFVDGYGGALGDYRLNVTPPGGATGPTMSLSCPASAPVGTDIVVPLTATVGSQALGAYAITLTYNPVVLHITGVAGATTGFFTGMPVANSGDWASGSSRINAYQTGSLVAPTGIVPLARVTFHVVGGSGAAPTIGLTARTLADTNGAAIAGVQTGGCP